MQACYSTPAFRSFLIRILYCASLLSLIVGFSASSDAYAAIDGRWECHMNLGGSGDYPQDMILAESGGSVTGTEVTAGTNTVFANISGTITGSSFNIRAQYTSSSYYADIVGSYSGDSMSGTWSNASQNGGFSCVRTSGSGSGGPTPTPTPGANSKRPTVTSLFCNRGGVLLERASCAATVGDAGAPVRTTPTGVISFVATGGFFPANAQCFPQQTPYSPGVASCIVEFQIPNGFPVGAKFPIDATYEGNSTFAPSSTSHTLIQAGCVGDAAHPCSGAVALSFSDLPQILKGKVKTIFECGGLPKAKSLELNTRGLTGDIQKACSGVITVDAKIGELLSKMSISELMDLSNAISKHDAQTDALLDALRTAKDPKYQQQLQSAVGNQIKIENLVIKILNDRANAIKNSIKRPQFLRSARKAKRSTLMSFGSSLISVKNNKVKAITVNLTKTSKLFLKAFSKATTDRALDLTFTIKGKRIGTKKTFNSKQIVRVGVK